MISLKAYLDAGVLVAYGLGTDDPHYAKAKSVINDITQGKYRGVVSILSLLETMDVIRKRITNRTPKTVLDRKPEPERKRYVSQESEKRYKELIEDLTGAAKAKKMLLIGFDGVDVGKVLAECNDLLVRNFGEIKPYDMCWQCRNRYEHYEYKGIGPIDAMHFDLAKRISCNLFITTDKGFSSLDGEMAVSVI